MTDSKKINIETLRESVHYEPLSGVFTWKKRISQRKLKGGNPLSKYRKDGYSTICIGKNTVIAQRAAYAIMTGEFPDSFISFKDGDKTNFKWENLEKSFSIGIKVDYSNREEVLSYQKEYRKQRPEINKDSYLQKRYGISIKEYKEMLDSQNGVCAICYCGETAMKNGKPLSLAVDHDHTTGDVRGLLCSKHNTGIGGFDDNIEHMKSAIAYLEKHKSKESNVIRLKGVK